MADLINQQYRVTKQVGNQTARVHVDISAEGEVTIRNDKNQPQFVFTKSDKDLIMAMALAFHEAAELVDKDKVKAGEAE